MSIAIIKALKSKYEQQYIQKIQREIKVLSDDKSKTHQKISESILSQLMEFVENEFKPITWGTDYACCEACGNAVKIKFYLERDETTKTIDSRIRSLSEKKEVVQQKLEEWEIKAYQAIASKQDIPKFEG